MKTSLRRSIGILVVWAAFLAVSAARAEPVQVPLVFSGGHETDPHDRGRPVALIAGALGVPAEVFREAFSHVHPAPAGTEPDPDQVRRNKEALMAALGPYGITNERLDAVSNRYRYNRSRGEMWPTQAATGYAVVENGAVVSCVVTAGGSGYSSPPAVAAPGFKEIGATAQLSWSKNFDENGAVSAITLGARTKPGP